MENAEVDVSVLITQMEAKVEELWKNVEKQKEVLAKARVAHEEANEELKKLKHRRTMAQNKEKIQHFEATLDETWIQPSFEWSDKATQTLKTVFKFDAFRPKQLAAINATLSKKDLILIMPTGGGKSLVYQLPALIEPGFTIVVSPLISLIEDQLKALEKVGVDARSLNASVSSEHAKQVYADMLEPTSSLKLLYVTPEYIFKSKRFMLHMTKCYQKERINRLAIDEVHCCSTWGHDFRPHYGMLNGLHTMMPEVPTLGVTATATREALTDILEQLKLQDPLIITAPFNRPNLFYEVREKPSSSDETLALLEKLLKQDYKDQTGIIYTSTVAETENLTSELKRKGLAVAPYNAQLSSHARKTIHKKWSTKKYQAVIATIAFGMGIDLPDVRFVIHHSVPSTLEGLYQESGRAGRDGLKSTCMVMFSLQDYLRVFANTVNPIQEQKTKQVLEYCLEVQSCRRSILTEYFDESFVARMCQDMCDICRDGEITTYDLSKICQDLHTIIDKATSDEQKLTLNKLIDAWYKRGPKKYRMDSSAPNLSREKAELIIAFLLKQEFFQVEKNFNLYSAFAYIVKGNPVTPNIFMPSCVQLPGVEKKPVKVSTMILNRPDNDEDVEEIEDIDFDFLYDEA